MAMLDFFLALAAKFMISFLNASSSDLKFLLNNPEL
jgi:hypothetical protein